MTGTPRGMSIYFGLRNIRRIETIEALVAIGI